MLSGICFDQDGGWVRAVGTEGVEHRGHVLII